MTITSGQHSQERRELENGPTLKFTWFTYEDGVNKPVRKLLVRLPEGMIDDWKWARMITVELMELVLLFFFGCFFFGGLNGCNNWYKNNG